MTRIEKLYSMRGAELIELAIAKDVKISYKGKSLKESKAAVIEKILRKEEEETGAAVIMPEIDRLPEVVEKHTATTSWEEKNPQTPKKQRKARAKKELLPAIDELLAYVRETWQEMGGMIKTPGKADAKFAPLCAEGGRQVVKLMWTAKKISLFIRIEEGTQYAEDWQKINYGMPFQCIYYNDSDENREKIKNLFTLVLEKDAIRKKKH